MRRINLVVFSVIFCATFVSALPAGSTGGPSMKLAIRFPGHLDVETLASDGRRISASRVALPRGVSEVSWSYDSRALAFVTQHDMYVQRFGGTLHRVVHESGANPEIAVAWSPRADVLLATVRAACDSAFVRTTQLHYVPGRTLLATPDGDSETIAPFVVSAALTT